MYLFIAIVFIAELIITGFILYWIVKVDKMVIALDFKVADFAPALTDGLKKTRECICIVQSSIDKAFEFIQRKKLEFWRRIVNLIVIYIILFFLKTKFKKAATFCQYAVFLKDCWDSIPT